MVIDCLGAKCEDDLLNTDMSIYDSVIVSYKFKVSSRLIDRLVNCRSIICACVGYDNVDFNYAAQKGIRVFNVPDYGTNDVADHTVALFLSYARRIVAYDKNFKEGKVDFWNPKAVRPFHRITNLTWGIIGMGRIGTAVTSRVKAFGMSVCFYDPYISNGYDKVYQVERCFSLMDLFEKSDVISIHAPLTEETYHLVNSDCLQKATKHPMVINTARGKIVDNATICRALREGIIESFLADVLEEEPPNQDDELRKLSYDEDFTHRIILTPHAASYAEESQYEMRYKSAEKAVLSFNSSQYHEDCVNYYGGVKWR